jgi:hypothetical protein
MMQDDKLIEEVAIETRRVFEKVPSKLISIGVVQVKPPSSKVFSCAGREGAQGADCAGDPHGQQEEEDQGAENQQATRTRIHVRLSKGGKVLRC